MTGKLAPVLVAVLVVATVATPAAAGTDAEPSLTVAVHEDGSANVVLTLTYDLTTDAEREAFRTLERDADARKQVSERFQDRMADVAASATNATGRETNVTNATVDVRTTPDNETGLVELAVTWKELAAVEDDRIVVTEPFASGFETDREVTFVAPEGYELADATPEPSAVTDGRVTWKPGTSLEGFELTFRPDGTEEATAGETTEPADAGEESNGSPISGEVPGFGIGIAVTSLLGAALLGLRR